VSICEYLQRPVSHRLPVYLQVLDLLMQVICGNLSVWIQVSIFGLKISAGQVQVDPQVNLWGALQRVCRLAVCGLAYVAIIFVGRIES